jgi:glycosyltransferase EpsD
MRKILYVATSDVHLKIFHLPYLEWLKSQGHEVSLAIENRGDIEFKNIDHIYYLKFPRSLKIVTYFSTYKKLKSIINNNHFDLIHCHTPLPSAITRLAARKARKNGTKILYTAHGFHFYKGAPLKNWFFYYTAEYILSAFTDGIITINKEDFEYINSKMLHKESFLINGIGIDATRFQTYNKKEIEKVRKELGYESKQFILLYIAGFTYNKNHQFIINAIPDLKKEIPELKIIFAGKGILFNKMKLLSAKYNLTDTIDFLGFRYDIQNFTAVADVGISSSRREGLDMGIAEEMICSLPVVASLNRGHKEIIDHGYNGFMYTQGDKKTFVNYIMKLYNNPELRKTMGNNSFKKAQYFRVEKSLKIMSNIYRKYLD